MSLEKVDSFKKKMWSFWVSLIWKKKLSKNKKVVFQLQIWKTNNLKNYVGIINIKALISLHYSTS